MPNELYVQWLKEWMDKAYDLQSKGYQTLRKAHDSMQACPFDIGHPSQAAQLKGIGPILCARLEKTLTAHCKANNVPMPQRPTNARESDSQEDAPVRKKRAVKPYVPNHGSGPWAILMGLSEPGARENLPKSEVIRLSQPFCSSSFEVASDVRGLYTAWNSMATLIIKELVHKTGNPAKYTLTDAGTEVASRLRAVPHPDVLVRDQTLGIVDLARQDTLVDTQEDDDEGPNSDVELELPPAPDVTTAFEPIVIPRGHFEIQLILDIREVKTQRDRSFIEEQLSQSNIDLRTRALDVGDAMWIAKCRDGGEIVLDHIVERKRMDDLVASIKDGRFHEQKFRLQKCGARHVIYVIEEQNMHEVMSYQEAIQTAISSTQIVTGFFVKRVQSLDYTIRYLVKLTKKLRTLYENQDLYILPDHMVDSRTFAALTTHLQEKVPDRKYYLTYDAFAGLTAKTITLQVGDVWLRMLMTIRGVSAEKAIEIQSVFPTLSHLLKAYDACADDSARDKLMTVSCVGYGRKSIGTALSKKIAAQFK